MKAHVVTLAAVIVAAGTGAAYAADETVTMNAIDANGVGKEIGTLRLSDTNAGLEITPALADLPPGDHGFHVHVNPNCPGVFRWWIFHSQITGWFAAMSGRNRADDVRFRE